MSSKRPCISISLLDDDEPIVFTPKSIVFPVIDLSRLARPKHSAEMKNLEAMAYRELGPEDYALLSQLDEAVEKPKHALNLLAFHSRYWIVHSRTVPSVSTDSRLVRWRCAPTAATSFMQPASRHGARSLKSVPCVSFRCVRKRIKIDSQ